MKVPFAFLLLALVGPLASTEPSIETSLLLSTKEGQERLVGSSYQDHYWQLSLYYETQQQPTYCGVATATMILNAIGIPRPKWREDSVFTLFMQDGFFNSEISAIVSKETALKYGITVEQMAQILPLFGVKAELLLGKQFDTDSFRELLEESLSSSDSYLMINYYRPAVAQIGKGHFAPVASYDPKTDSVLIMDVARFKYPPMWVPLTSLVASMQVDDEETGAPRGLIVVRK